LTVVAGMKKQNDHAEPTKVEKQNKVILNTGKLISTSRTMCRLY